MDAQCPIPDAEIGLMHLGGALNEHDEDDGNRDARFAIGANGMWEPGEPDVEVKEKFDPDNLFRSNGNVRAGMRSGKV